MIEPAHFRFKRIAFSGYAGCGKDEIARSLIALGYARRCFGDLIKEDLDAVIRKRFGFSAFTEDRTLKPKIRGTLQAYGDDAYEWLMEEFFRTLPELCVNTRLCRAAEAERWIANGGVIFLITRPGVGPETEWAKESIIELIHAGVFRGTILNDGSIADLHNFAGSLTLEDEQRNWIASIDGDLTPYYESLDPRPA